MKMTEFYIMLFLFLQSAIAFDCFDISSIGNVDGWTNRIEISLNSSMNSCLQTTYYPFQIDNYINDDIELFVQEMHLLESECIPFNSIRNSEFGIVYGTLNGNGDRFNENVCGYIITIESKGKLSNNVKILTDDPIVMIQEFRSLQSVCTNCNNCTSCSNSSDMFDGINCTDSSFVSSCYNVNQCSDCINVVEVTYAQNINLVEYSNNIFNSHDVANSSNIFNSSYIFFSSNVSESTIIYNSNNIYNSANITNSNNVTDTTGCINCINVINCTDNINSTDCSDCNRCVNCKPLGQRIGCSIDGKGDDGYCKRNQCCAMYNYTVSGETEYLQSWDCMMLVAVVSIDGNYTQVDKDGNTLIGEVVCDESIRIAVSMVAILISYVISY